MHILIFRMNAMEWNRDLADIQLTKYGNGKKE